MSNTELNSISAVKADTVSVSDLYLGINCATSGVVYSNSVSSVTDEVRSAINELQKKKDVREDTNTTLEIKNKKIYAKYYKDGFYKYEKFLIPDISDVKQYDNAVIVVFADGTTTKAILDNEDVFNLERGISICITKKLLGEHGDALYNKVLKRAFRVIDKNKKEKQRENEKKAELKRIKENYATKKQKRLDRKREDRVDMYKEAIVRAFSFLSANNSDHV